MRHKTHDRFINLLNVLSLVGKEYGNEKSNMEFLLAVPEKWYLKITTIRDNNDLDNMSLNEVYGIFKTYELGMHQRKNRKGSKAKSVALTLEEKSAKANTGSSSQYKGNVKYIESENDSSKLKSDTNSNADSDNESTDMDVKQLLALVVKSFKKKGRSSKRENLSRNSSNADKDKYKKK